MKTALLFLFVFCVSPLAIASDFEEQVSQQYPEAVTKTESYPTSEIANSTKRQPKSVTKLTVDRDVLLSKLMQKIEEQQQEIENLKKTIQSK